MSKDYPTLSEISAFLQDLSQRYPGLVSVEAVGRSVENREILMATVTDRAASDEDKQIALLMAGQHGDEHGSVGTMLKMLEWLVSGEADEVRQRQSVAVIPCVNVDSYDVYKHKNKNTVDLYRNYMLETVRPERISPPQPESIYKETLRLVTTQPESAAVWAVVERLKPEVIVDTHGSPPGEYDPLAIGPNFTGYDAYFREQMPAEARYVPELLGRVPIVDPVRPTGRDRGEVLEAAYHLFHSWGFGMHHGDEGRMSALLKLGCGRWPTEYYRGYPVNALPHYTSYPANVPIRNGPVYLTACGATAQARRASRVELWQKRLDLTVLYNQSMRPDSGVQAAWVQNYGEDYGRFTYHGMSLRFHLPKGARLAEVALNMQRLEESEQHGYIAWEDPCWAWVQVNISKPYPEGSGRALAHDTVPFDALITISYK